ncbi:MAG: valine--tRNA ligase [Candidatus Burarchaeum sp.]|nr:valine--tRNA ligase [Candidatus Burarchaeum sp.]MDO8340070.1 valine--tRNA ligase [Candidatus Burarchaeum sp.]
MLDKYSRELEVKWQKQWEELGVHKFDEADASHPIYSIDTPPPFTSGDLHMGHVLSYAYFDFVARYKRMNGFNVFYPQGWDCQGFPTEVKVEAKFGRGLKPEEFRKHCVEWTHKYIERMRAQMVRMGFSPDWRHEYRTMDPEYCKKVQLSILKMHGKELVYRGEHPVYWCTHCVSAIAKAEIDDLERDTTLNYVKFNLASGAKSGQPILIATTRPEFLHACVAVLVHPEDERYSALVGSEVEVPIFKQKVKLIADKDVMKEFGTGVVMVCTFGDKTDTVWAYRHNLKIVRALDERGRMLNCGEYNGMKAEEARKLIVEKLQAEGLMEKREPLKQVVKVHDRCTRAVELLLSRQWFMKVKGHEQEIIAAAKSMRWVPEFTIQYLIDWANYIEWDWVISRQRVFGTPLPFWNCGKCGKAVEPAESELPVNPPELGERKCTHCGGVAKPETSTCDCWVDSSITPLVIAGWPDGKHFGQLFPASLRPQGTEIIRTWAFYTIYRSLMLTGKAPFHELLLNGNVLAPDGKKMSKSLGNIIAPDELIEKYSADAIRQWVALSGALARDRPFRNEDIQHAQLFITKLWNSAKFVQMMMEGYEPDAKDSAAGAEADAKARTYDGELAATDKWILSRLNRTIETCGKGYEEFDFHTVINAIHEFTWHEFCDYYLENVKHRLYNPEIHGAESKRAAQFTLRTVFYAVLRLLAPIAPHVNEEIYQELFAKAEGHRSIALAPFPQADSKMVSEEAEKKGELLNKIIGEMRRTKRERKMPLNAELARISVSLSADEAKMLEGMEADIKAISRAREFALTTGEFGVACE